MNDKPINLLDKIIAGIIRAMVFFLPWFFLPWAGEQFEFYKQILIQLCLPLALSLWLFQAIRRGELRFQTNPYDKPILVFLFLAMLSAWLSVDRFSSFFGYFGSFLDNYFGLLSLASLYFLLKNGRLADSSGKIIELVKLSVYSSVAVAFIFLFSLLNGFEIFFGRVQPGWLGQPLNLTGNSFLTLAIYLVVAALSQAYLLSNRIFSRTDRLIFSLGLIMNLIILLLIDFPLSWFLFFAGLSLIIFSPGFIFGFRCRNFLDKSLLLPAALILITGVMSARAVIAWPGNALALGGETIILYPRENILGQNWPQEAVQNYGSALAITRGALLKYPALGSGPGTYAYDFSLYRPSALNQSQFWQFRLDKSTSYFLGMLATAGILTSLIYFLIVSLVIYLNIILLKKHIKSGRLDSAGGDCRLIIFLSVIFILLFLAQFFFYVNTILLFIFWLNLGLIAAFWQNHESFLFKQKIINFQADIRLKRLIYSAALIIGCALAVFIFFEIKFIAADIFAAKASDRETGLISAVKLNPYRFHYQLRLAEFYFDRAKGESLKPADARNNIDLQYDITKAVEAARQARAMAPDSVLAEETLGAIYRDVRLFTRGSEPWALQSFISAFSLEPTNPVLATELAKAYINNNDIANAEKYFKKALELKPDYFEAKFGLAKLYLSQKKDLPALTLLKALERQVADPEVYYELGRFYYNRGESDLAIEKFILAVKLAPEHFNSLYALGIAYETKGEIARALEYYEKILALNPANEEIREKIEELNKALINLKEQASGVK